MTAFFESPTGQKPEGVYMLDPATGLPVAPGQVPLSDLLTDAQLRAAPVPVSMAATPGLTNAEMRATAVPVTGPTTVKDSTGAAFDPDACAHTYAYSNGLLTTDTATDGGVTWVKTYSYTAGALTGETKWVRQ